MVACLASTPTPRKLAKKLEPCLFGKSSKVADVPVLGGGAWKTSTSALAPYSTSSALFSFWRCFESCSSHLRQCFRGLVRDLTGAGMPYANIIIIYFTNYCLPKRRFIDDVAPEIIKPCITEICF
jgi:hypothetical protein